MSDTGFRRWELVDPSTVAALFEPGERRGIYVLEFADGERYVGQTEDVVTRYSTHRHGSNHHEAWPDVTAISFLPIPVGDLDGPERDAIREQRAHFRLRNRVHNFGHWEPSALDDVIEPETQRHWATGQAEYDLAPFVSAAKSLGDGTPKLLHSRRGQEELPDGRQVWEAVVDELAQVVALAIPDATETEGRFWSISDYPATARGRFATLNAGSLELLYFPRGRVDPEFGSLEASAGLVSVLNADIGTFIDPADLPSRFSLTDGVGCPEVIDGHAVSFFREPSNYSVPVDSVESPLGVFGARVLDPDQLGGVRSLVIHAMRRGSARINMRSRSEALTRLVYERIADPAFQDWVGY